MNRKLTNRDISDNYRDYAFWLFPSSLLSAFAFWVVYQNQNEELVLEKPLNAFKEYIKPFFPKPKLPTKFTYAELSEIIDDTVFEKIPEIMALNTMKPDFIDLEALASNIFYMILREEITSGLIDKIVTDKILTEPVN